MQLIKSRNIFFALTFSHMAILIAISAINYFGADRWWFGALNLYLPQILWGLPAIPLFVYSLRYARRWVWAPLLCILWVAIPIMDLHLSIESSAEPTGSPSLRIMTCNAKYGKHDISGLIGDIDRYRPDVVLLQDAGGSLDSRLGEYIKNWHVRSFEQYVIASRYPLSEAEVLWDPVPGEREACLRCRLRLGHTELTIYNVHFQTPREGLNAFRSTRKKPWYLPMAIHRLEENVAARLSQARIIAGFLRQEKGPVIVGGDMNSPDSSMPCMTMRHEGFHDAFAEGGTGYGYTYGHYLLQHRLPFLRLSWMRIDHIMMSSQLQTRRCWIGSGKASDHRPVMADITLKLP